MNKKRYRAWLQGMILLVDILLSWAFFYICQMWLRDIFGPDIIVYENWFGDLENPVEYRFGIGCVEILITLLQVVLFVCIELILYKKQKAFKVYTYIAIVVHALNFLCWVLFYVDWNSWGRIPAFLLPQNFVIEILYYM